MERFLDYWCAGQLQVLLHNFKPAQIANNWQNISAQELRSGKFIASDLSKPHDNSMLIIAPYIAQRDTELFIPCLLLAELIDGQLVPQLHLSLPIIPRCNLEQGDFTAISLGQDLDFDNYMAINPAPWLDDVETLNWSVQLEYAQKMLQDICPNWQSNLQAEGFTILEQALVATTNSINHDLAVDQINFDAAIFDNLDKITIVDAQRNADTHSYIRKIVADAWVHAAVQQTDPPQYVWLRPDTKVEYATIFNCLHAKESSNDFNSDIYTQLLAMYENYNQGLHVLRHWREAVQRLQDKYSDKGGIEARLQQLNLSAQEAKAHTRHVQVLYSIWLRQNELLAQWSKILDFIPTLQKQRLARLHSFFAQNFPNDDVTGFSQTQFNDLINEKVRRAENNERMIGDTLHQVESDVYQMQLVKDKCLAWCKVNDCPSEDFAVIEEFISVHVWNKLLQVTLQYWQQDFASKQQYANYLTQQPARIDLLLVEHAEYISPLQAVQLLAVSKRVTIVGNYNPLCVPRIPTQIDYELTKRYGLAENDADFEDLQYEGVVVSTGNMWNMLTQQREADEFISENTDQNLQFVLVDVATSSSAYLGSIVNQGAIVAVVDWLNIHYKHDLDYVIYTCFAAQAKLLRETLSNKYPMIQVEIMQRPCFAQADISIFVPVYSTADPGPYIFDRGVEIFDQLLANTREQLIIIGDKRIFKPELHSATGKFAQNFAAQLQAESTIKTEEAYCV